MLLAPAQTTIMGVRPSSMRSAETSMLLSAPRCTPPMPPVTNESMPALAATTIVPATVVPPARLKARAGARSRRLTLTAGSVRGVAGSARAVSSASERPTRTRPSRSAMVAGTAPCARTIASTDCAVVRFAGKGMPAVRWAKTSQGGCNRRSETHRE